MFFTDSIRRLTGSISVEVIARPRKYHQIRISGVRGDLLASDMQFYFKTSRVGTYMFDALKSNFILFPAFFALEVLEVMDKIITAPRNNYTSRYTAKKIRDALIEGTWLSRTENNDYERRINPALISRLKFKPLPFQETWLEKFDKVTNHFALNGAILDAVMGSGKTYMGLAISECSGSDVTVIVSPKNAMDRVWVDSIRDLVIAPTTVWRSDSAHPYKGERYMVVHYEGLANALPLVQALAAKKKKICIVLDESHNFNEIKSARTQLMIELCQSSKSELIVLQSGTPFKAIGAEIIPALYMIDPTFSEEIAERFKKLYAASATEALELLKRRLGHISHKVVKEELGLAPPIIQNIPVKTPNSTAYTLESVAAEMGQFVKERAIYYRARKAQDEQAYKDITERFASGLAKGPATAAYVQYESDVKIIRRGDLRSALEEITRSNGYERSVILPGLSSDDARLFKEVKTIYKYVTLKIQGECLGQILGKRRMECSVEIARAIDYDRYIQSATKKTLVYTIYVQALESARERVKELGYKPLAVYGETNKNLNSIISDFDRDPEINPLIATFHSLSTAVPLTMASVLLCIDTPFRSHTMVQAIARINRLGATEQTYVYIAGLDTDGMPNLSSRTIDILKWSQSQIEKITGVAPPFELTDVNVSTEAMALAGESLRDAHFVEIDLEEAFMKRLV